MLEIFFKFLKETIRLFLEMSPYLILGFFFTGLLHIFISEKYIKKNFSTNGFSSIFKAAFFGVPLPVCSCGVIPIAESIRKDGASKSSTMAFLVSTPSSGVDSIFATYALLGPIYAIIRPIASLFSGIIIGIVTFFAEKTQNSNSVVRNKKAESGNTPKRTIKDGIKYGFKVIPSDIAKWLIIGVIVGGMISTLVPEDFGTRYLESTVLNYLMILIVSIPLYVCATGSIPIAVSLLAKGVLPGAALAFLIAGPATNTVTISFVLKRMGKKIAFLYVFTIMLVSILFGVLFDLIISRADINLNLMMNHGHNELDFYEIISGIVLILILINSKFNLWGFKMNKGNIYSIKVSDMTCQHCKMKIEGVVNKIEGIEKFSVDLKNQEVLIDTDKVQKDIIINKIKEAGYSPE